MAFGKYLGRDRPIRRIALLSMSALRPDEPPPKLKAPGDGLGGDILKRIAREDRLTPWQRVAVVFVVIAITVVVALLTRPWGMIALGALAGVLVARDVGAARVAMMPLLALGRAAAPLLLPVLVLVAAGVVKDKQALQFVIGLVVALVATLWLIHPERSRIEHFFERYRRADWGEAQKTVRSGRTTSRLAWDRAWRIARVGMPLAIAVVGLGLVVGSIADLLFTRSNIDTTTRFLLAVGCLAAAAVLRLVFYATTAFRAAVALAILLWLARLSIDAGIIPAIDVLDDIAPTTLAVIAGALLAITALIELVVALLARAADEGRYTGPVRAAALLETQVTARWVTDRAAVVGLALSLASALFLLAAIYAASRAGGSRESAQATTAENSPPRAFASMSDDAIKTMFSPVLAFRGQHPRWTPIPVDDYLAGAKYRDWEGRWSDVARPEDLPDDCPGVVKSPCYTLRPQCEKEPSPAECAEGMRDDHAVYVRVARREQWRDCEPRTFCVDGSPDPFAGARGPYAQTTQILVEYWYFYPFNDWVAPVVAGELHEIHPGDWESVTVGLSHERPLWVAYSAHCAGTWAHWADVPVADRRRLRPLVAVADGSQANYRLAEGERVPNFAECNGIANDRLRLISYAANIKDLTGSRTYWDPDPSALRRVDARDPPMSFPGFWSTYGRLSLDNLRKSHTLKMDHSGPRTPSLQSVWQSPMRTIFGDGAWEEG